MRIRFDYHSLTKFGKRLCFYGGGFTRYYMPSSWFRMRFRQQLKKLTPQERAYAESRVGYYVKFGPDARLDEKEAVTVRDFKFPWHKKHRFSGYFFLLLSAKHFRAIEKLGLILAKAID